MINLGNQTLFNRQIKEEFIMNKWLWLILILLAPILSLSADLMLPDDCSGSYLIELKTGVSFVTDQYWEEDGQIKFNHYGGMMGVSKDMIASVTKSDAPIPEETIQPEPIEGAAELGGENPSGFEEKALQYQDDLTQNQNEIDGQAKKFNTAKAQKDQAAKDAAWKALTGLKEEQNQLRNKVITLYNGKLPKWWGEITGEEL